MTTVTRPRGPLPPRVYWTRRLLLVVVAFALVFGLARLLGSGGSGGPTARPVGATPSSADAQVTTPGAGSQAIATGPAAGTGKKRNKKATPTPTPLASPSGACADTDVVTTPSVKGTAYAGQPVVFTMTLATQVSEACTWEVSSRTLVVKVTSGVDRIWSTQECFGAVPKQSVVVRRDHPTTVAVGWNGQRSDTDCTRSTAWAEPGYYHVVSASFGADPVDVQFELKSPVPRTITATPTPSEKPSASASASASATASASPSKQPTQKPSKKPSQKPSAQR
ncbi:MAG: hypothetical protein ABIQ59_16850 [Nocardioidaceae bacterium]